MAMAWAVATATAIREQPAFLCLIAHVHLLRHVQSSFADDCSAHLYLCVAINLCMPVVQGLTGVACCRGSRYGGDSGNSMGGNGEHLEPF